MRARVERQKVMLLAPDPINASTAMYWRAVCDDLAHGEPILDNVVPQTWQERRLRDAWFDAYLDGILHDYEEHPEALKPAETGGDLAFQDLVSGGTLGSEGDIGCTLRRS